MDFNLFSRNSVLSPQDKKQRLMAAILVVVVLGTIIISYFGFWRSPASPSTEILTDTEALVRKELSGMDAAEKDIIQKIDFDADFLKDSRFQTLKIYGEWPLEANEKGRTNPFLPY